MGKKLRMYTGIFHFMKHKLHKHKTGSTSCQFHFALHEKAAASFIGEDSLCARW